MATSRRLRRGPTRGREGFTLIELLAVTAILAILAAISIMKMQSALEAARIAEARSELRGIFECIEQWRLENGDAAPTSLQDLVPRWYSLTPNDPWGRPYVYNSFALIAPGLKRKVGPIVPINKDYDLFSAGNDGSWNPNILSQPSRDDVLVANNGGFIGLSTDY